MIYSKNLKLFFQKKLGILFGQCNKRTVSCKTEENANDFIKKTYQNASFRQKWCHMVYNARSQGYDIVNWSDFVTDIKNPYSLKEKYLKSGYIISLQDTRTALILIHGNVIYFLDSDNNNYAKFNVEDYDSNLDNCVNLDYTIMEIYSQIKGPDSVETAMPVWSR